MRLVLLKEIPEDAHLRRQWNDLALRVEHPQVFYTYEWALAVQRAYRAFLQSLLFLAYDEQGLLAGVAALARDPSGRVSFLCATTGDYCDFLSLPEQRADFIAEVLAELRQQGIREITLTNLPADSASAAAIERGASASKYRCYARTAYICAQVVLEKIERRPGDDLPVLPRKKMVRRFLNAMGREEPVRLEHAREWSKIQPVLPEFMRAHVARFLATGRISNLARAERQVFLTELAKLLSDSGWVVLTRMVSGRNVFAWNYGFQYQDTWFWYQPTFVSELEKYSPGFCLMVKLIEEAAGIPGLKIVDLGLGAEEYKDRVANQERRTLYVTLKASLAKHYREMLRFKAAEAVRALRAEAAVRGMLQKWQRARNVVGQKGARGTPAWLIKRLLEKLWSKSEVFFYEWRSVVFPVTRSLKLQRLSMDDVVSATSQYVDDPPTLDYLVRATARLQEGKAEGYALIDADGRLVHFAWTTGFAGFFLSELNDRVEAPAEDCVMLFDCWTPVPARGHGYYAHAVEMVAEQVRKKGKRPWIFSAASNDSSVRGLEKTGFERRYSLVRRRFLGWQRIRGKTPKTDAAAAAEVSANA